MAVSHITSFMRAPTCSSAPPCSKGISAFWASSACQPSATSYPSCSAAPLPWPSGFSWAAPVFKSGRPLLAFGSNFAVKRTASPPLTLAVSTEENQFISPMLFQTAFSFSSVVQRLVCRFSGLRLLALHRFPAFLASSHFSVSASGYCFCSAAQPRWRSAFSQFVPVAKFRLSVSASGSNISVKPTRLRRVCRLAWALAPKKPPLYLAHVYSNGIQFLKRCSALGLPFLRASPASGLGISSLFGIQPLHSKRF